MNQSQPLNILLCDDNEDDKFFFGVALKKTQIPALLKTFGDGEELLAYLKENDNLPDVLFLDLNMPRKNGFEALEEIRQIQKLRELPVIIYTTTNSKETIEKVLGNGANMYIVKPDDPDKLKLLLEKAIEEIFATYDSVTERIKLVLNSQNDRG